MPGRIDPTSTEESDRVEPVRKSLRVRASPERAFQVFTTEMDSWWPRSHHIGSSPMAQVIVEPRAGGRIYTIQEDGADCQWGEVLSWEPPYRFVMAWRISPGWQRETDLSRCSEVEVRFTPVDHGGTLVELEHRHFERHGRGHAQMRNAVDSVGGWGSLLQLFAQTAQEPQL